MSLQDVGKLMKKIFSDITGGRKNDKGYGIFMGVLGLLEFPMLFFVALFGLIKFEEDLQ